MNNPVDEDSGRTTIPYYHPTQLPDLPYDAAQPPAMTPEGQRCNQCRRKPERNMRLAHEASACIANPREEMLDSRAGGETGKTIRKVEKPGRENKETAEAVASRQDHWPETHRNEQQTTAATLEPMPYRRAGWPLRTRNGQLTIKRPNGTTAIEGQLHDNLYPKKNTSRLRPPL